MQKVSSGLKKIYLKDNIPKHILICLFYSSLFYWFWTVYSDCYNLKMQDIIRLPIDLEDKSWDIEKFQHLYEEIISSMYNNGKHVTYNKKNGVTEYFEFKPRLSKNIFDRVDRELATYYGLDEDEYKFIINYDLKYRVDDEETDKNEL